MAACGSPNPFTLYAGKPRPKPPRPVTTLAVGEESPHPPGPKPDVTTLAVGEEAARPPGITTLAVGEEGA